jgi:hypothetical protein
MGDGFGTPALSHLWTPCPLKVRLHGRFVACCQTLGMRICVKIVCVAVSCSRRQSLHIITTVSPKCAGDGAQATGGLFCEVCEFCEYQQNASVTHSSVQ